MNFAFIYSFQSLLISATPKFISFPLLTIILNLILIVQLVGFSHNASRMVFLETLRVTPLEAFQTLIGLESTLSAKIYICYNCCS